MLLKEKNNPKSIRNILIIRFSSIGDILLTTNIIRQIRINFPEAKISFVTKEVYQELIQFNPNIDQIFILKNEKRGLQLLATELRKQSFDYIIDLHNNYRSTYLRFKLRSKKTFVYKKPLIRRFLLVNFKINLFNKQQSIPLRYLKSIKKLSIIDDFKGLELFWPVSTDEEIYTLTRSITGDLIVLAPGAGFFTKRWPIEYFSELVEKLSEIWPTHNFCVLGSQAEAYLATYLTDKSPKVHNFCGKLSLLQSASLISKAKLVISNDSGLMHVASAVKTSVVGIFGSTVREFGFFPFRAKHVIVENNKLNCRPCSHIGKKTCPEVHFKCMREIKPELVMLAAKSLLE